jgi:hypothetical protein
MKSQIAKIGGAVTLGLFLMGMGSKAGAAPSTPADHLAVAAQCEKKATDVQASIDQVLKAKADNMSQWKLRKASPPSRKITLADEKYNETLASLTAEKDQWMQLAQYHKLRALEGQTPELASTGSPSTN